MLPSQSRRDQQHHERVRKDMTMHLRARFWFETALAALTVGLFLLTLVSRNWIEVVFGIEPDQSDGSLEWIIVGALFVASVALIGLARAEWQRSRAPVS